MEFEHVSRIIYYDTNNETRMEIPINVELYNFMAQLIYKSIIFVTELTGIDVNLNFRYCLHLVMLELFLNNSNHLNEGNAKLRKDGRVLQGLKIIHSKIKEFRLHAHQSQNVAHRL